MSYLLWFVMFLVAAIPAMTCLVYYHRRLGTRRELLKQTLVSMDLTDAYMKARHGEVQTPVSADNFSKYFDHDFRAGLSAKDYFWPVALFTILSLIGWFLTFSRMYGSFTGLFDAKSFLPEYFALGFAGAFLASVLAVFDEFRKLNLDPNVYYSITYRVLFSSTAAYLAGQVFSDKISSMAAFGVGLLPVQKMWEVITDKTSQAMGVAKSEGEPGAELANIQGLEDKRSRQKMLDNDISTVQALATCDPFWLFFQTTFPLRSVIDMIDKAILYLYIGDTTKELRQHGINGVIELACLVPLADRKSAYKGSDGGLEAADVFFEKCDVDGLLGKLATVTKMDAVELKAFIYNLYYDPMVMLIYDIWGRYLNPRALEEKVEGERVVAAGR